MKVKSVNFIAISFFGFMLFLAPALNAQENTDSIEILIDELIEINRGANGIKLDNAEELFDHDLKQVFDVIEECYRGEEENVQALLQHIVISIGGVTEEAELKRRIVNFLFNSVRNARNLSMFQTGLKALQKYRAKDFDEAARIELKALLEKYRKNPLNKIIALLGVADLREEEDYLRSMIDKCKEGKSVTSIDDLMIRQSSGCYTAIAVLARMGDKEAINFVLQYVRHFQGDLITTKGYLKRLSYVRQPEVVDYFKEILLSDLSYPGPHGGISKLAFTAMDFLDDMLEDFPIQPKKRAYGLGDLDTVRAWIKEKKKSDYIIIK